VSGVEEITGLVVTVKVAEELPAVTATFAGTAANELLLDSAIVMPPVGAGPVRVTVPVEGLPPVTAVGLRVREESATTPVMVNGASAVTPL